MSRNERTAQNARKKRKSEKGRAVWVIVAIILLLAASVIGAVNVDVRVLLNGSIDETVSFGAPYSDPGADATFGFKQAKKRGVLPVERTGEVDTQTLGSYTLTYSAKKWFYEDSATRTVHVVDTEAPAITLLGAETVFLTEGKPYKEAGFTAMDACEGDLSARVSVSGAVDTDTPGTYELRYEVEDGSHNKSIAVRKIVVQKREIKPSKVIYLTFDDGPGPYTARLLDILAKYDAKATFFVANVGFANLITREAEEGHTVGAHSFSHIYKTIYASEEAYFADLDAINDVIYEKTGSRTNIIRFPGGSSNTVSSFNEGIMTRLAAAVQEKGYYYFDWNVSSGDAGGVRTSEEVFQNVVNGVSGRANSVVLMHDIHEFSVDAVEQIVVWGLENGYAFLPLTEESFAAHHVIHN